jgi:curved DNA-binding protein CbpA
MPDEQTFVDYYRLLGVQTNADALTIRRTFISKAKMHHPDVGGTTETMQQLSHAYRTLTNLSSRKAYDLMHAFQTGTAQVQYYHYGEITNEGSQNDLSDDEIDAFLDKIYAEYHNQPKPKQSIITKIKNAL